MVRAEYHCSVQLSPKRVEHNVPDMRRQLWPVSNINNKAMCSITPTQKQPQFRKYTVK